MSRGNDQGRGSTINQINNVIVCSNGRAKVQVYWVNYLNSHADTEDSTTLALYDNCVNIIILNQTCLWLS